MKGKVVHKKFYIKPDPLRKQQIKDIYIDSMPHLKLIKKSKKPIRIIALSVGILYFLLGIAVNSWQLTHGEAFDIREYFNLAFVSLLIYLLGYVLSFIVKTALTLCAKKNLGERLDEEIEMHADYFRYSFRKGEGGAKRHIVTVEFDKVKAEYDPMLRQIVLRGSMQELLLEGAMVGQEKKTATNIESFVMYDYFDPSLHLVLKREGIPILDQHTREWEVHK